MCKRPDLQAENATIADIQKRLEAWYTQRDTPLARAGLKAPC